MSRSPFFSAPFHPLKLPLRPDDALTLSTLATRGISLRVSEDALSQGILSSCSGNSILFLGLGPDKRVFYASRLSSQSEVFEELPDSDERCPVVYEGLHKRSPLQIFLSPLDMLAYLTLRSLRGENFRECSCLVLPLRAQEGNTEALKNALALYLSSHTQVGEIHLYLPRDREDLSDRLREVLSPRKALYAHYYAPGYNFAQELRRQAGRMHS